MPDVPRLPASAEPEEVLATAEVDAAYRHPELLGRPDPGDAGVGHAGSGLRSADERVAMLGATLRHLCAGEAD